MASVWYLDRHIPSIAYMAVDAFAVRVKSRLHKRCTATSEVVHEDLEGDRSGRKNSLIYDMLLIEFQCDETIALALLGKTGE